MKPLFLLAFLFPLFGMMQPRPAITHLSITVTNIRDAGGSLRVAFFQNPNTFLEPTGLSYKKVLPITNQNSARVEIDLPYGTYAISAYHDLNDSHLMDRNTLGVPTEPFAMSNNPKVRWRKPTFDECKINLNQPNQSLQMSLRRWNE